MKKATTKALVCVLFAVILAALMTVSAMAETYPATEDDAIKNGEAKLEIQYKAESPVVDGVVNDGEYYEIPTDSLLGYYSYIFPETLAGYTAESKYAELLDYAENRTKVYACWDGKNFCFAVVADAPADMYSCPSADANSVWLFANWCLQCGFAAPDAEAEARMEVGLGASSDNIGENFAYDSWGTRNFENFVQGENFFSVYDNVNHKITYEVKVSIKEVTGVAAANNSQMRFLYLLSQSADEGLIQISCGDGCSAEKNTGWYLLLTFVGLSEGETIADDEEEGTVEEELAGYWNKTDFRKDSVVDTITDNSNVTIEKKTDENGDKYITVTATGANPYFGGSKIPIGLNADQVTYLAVRYRTTSTKASWVGFSYQSSSLIEDSTEYLFTNDYKLVNDGQWHTTVIDTSFAPNWNAFITNMRIWVFADSEEDVTGDSIDIMWLKYYTEEPDFGEVYEEVTEAATTVAEVTTAAEVATTAAETVTAATEAATVAEEATTATASEKKKGCGSVIAISMLIPALTAIAFVKKKKDH